MRTSPWSTRLALSRCQRRTQVHAAPSWVGGLKIRFSIILQNLETLTTSHFTGNVKCEYSYSWNTFMRFNSSIWEVWSVFAWNSWAYHSVCGGVRPFASKERGNVSEQRLPLHSGEFCDLARIHSRGSLMAPKTYNAYLLAQKVIFTLKCLK